MTELSKSAEKKWIALVASQGCVILSPRVGQPVTHRIQIHHVVGRTRKQNKVLIGPWFILPLWWDYHDVHSNDPLCVTHHKHAFTAEFGKQHELFQAMCDRIIDNGGELPFGDDVMQAIIATEE